jgi:hypothetical protein
MQDEAENLIDFPGNGTNQDSTQSFNQGQSKDAPATTNVPAKPGNLFAKMALGIFPLSPLPLTGPDAWQGYTRVAIYSVGAYMAWSKSRRLSYFLMGAGGISLAASMTSGAWEKMNRK